MGCWAAVSWKKAALTKRDGGVKSPGSPNKPVWPKRTSFPTDQTDAPVILPVAGWCNCSSWSNAIRYPVNWWVHPMDFRRNASLHPRFRGQSVDPSSVKRQWTVDERGSILIMRTFPPSLFYFVYGMLPRLWYHLKISQTFVFLFQRIVRLVLAIVGESRTNRQITLSRWCLQPFPSVPPPSKATYLVLNLTPSIPEGVSDWSSWFRERPPVYCSLTLSAHSMVRAAMVAPSLLWRVIPVQALLKNRGTWVATLSLPIKKRIL